MAETNKVITKVENRQGTHNFGATFDHVFVSDNNPWTLMDLYNYLKDFLESPLFEQYGTNVPSVDNINIWYDTTEKPIQEVN